ncbi:hypothetical protein LV89_01094 [Arcicella aurantiaca]|uniref:Uncharacterized protein n=1 Tax=Arcicella aurantiaca TaxID=591202 RepID=A0A316ECV6_9BACT|nr:hypothetical protein [Arcicella aurantiaca]PWK28311.1 hypothetical protein LV89_01094 [Arcicella aurantiaca]
MTSMVITPRNKSEMKLLSDLFKKMQIQTQLVSDEIQEDLGLAMMMKEADRSEKVSRESIMAKLRKHEG